MLLTRARVIEAASRVTSENNFIRKALASSMLREAQEARSTDGFDVFLSHARLDEEIVLGTKLRLERYGFSVYVDWIDDPAMDRSRVTQDNAALLRERMRQCTSLLYIHTENTSESRWTPWELGYFDGYRGRVAIVPIVETADEEYVGEEYLGLYPYLDVYRDNESKWRLWVNQQGSRTRYAPLRSWLKNPATLRERTPW